MSLGCSSSRTMNGMMFSPTVAVQARQLGKVDARDRIGRNIPGRRYVPVAGIDELRAGSNSGIGWFCADARLT